MENYGTVEPHQGMDMRPYYIIVNRPPNEFGHVANYYCLGRGGDQVSHIDNAAFFKTKQEAQFIADEQKYCKVVARIGDYYYEYWHDSVRTTKLGPR